MGGEYYDRLGVSSDASMAEIASAYRERLKETHPDVNDANDAGERTKRLIEAKEVLTDETERARYDRLGHDRYVRLEQGQTPDSGEPSGETGQHVDTDGQTTSKQSAAHGSGTDPRGDSTATASGGPRDRQAGTRGADARGTRAGRGVDWGTHTARRGRGRHTDGVDWEEWAETDWDAVADAVWDEVTGERTGGSTATDSDTQSTDSTPGDRTTAPGWSDTVWSGPNDGGTAGSAATGTGGTSTAAGSSGTAAGATAGGGSAATTGRASGPAAGATAGDAGPTAGAEGSRDWTVGWYSGGDPSGTTRDSYSFGGSEGNKSAWDTWSPGSNGGSRYSRSSFPPHRIFSPLQTVVMFCLCFVTYPLLVAGSVFPFFSSPVRLLLAMFLVFVVAMLIILSQLGLLVFGGWALLFPVVFVNAGVPVLAVPSLVTMSAVVLSLGLAGVSRLLIRPPVV